MELQKTGKFISELRKAHGWTQKELAERVGVTDKAVSRWETGRGFPEVSSLTVLADLLGVSVTELVRGERLELDGKEPAEIMQSLDRTVVNTLELSRKNAGRAAALLLSGAAGLICVFVIIYQELVLFWSDIPARFAAYSLLVFFLISFAVPAVIHWMPSDRLRRTIFRTYLYGLAAAFLLVMLSCAFFRPEFFTGLTDFALLRYDFNDTVVYEVLFWSLPLCLALTAAVNTVFVAVKMIWFKTA